VRGLYCVGLHFLSSGFQFTLFISDYRMLLSLEDRRPRAAVFNHNTYVMAQADGNVKIFKAAGVYKAAEDADIIETVI
jgi:hypothetical protein